MSKEEIFQELTRILQDQKGKDFPVYQEMKIQDQLGSDSVELMEFIVTMEEDLNVSIPDAAIDSFVTLNDVVDFIAKQETVSEN